MDTRDDTQSDFDDHLFNPYDSTNENPYTLLASGDVAVMAGPSESSLSRDKAKADKYLRLLQLMKTKKESENKGIKSSLNSGECIQEDSYWNVEVERCNMSQIHTRSINRGKTNDLKSSDHELVTKGKSFLLPDVDDDWSSDEGSGNVFSQEMQISEYQSHIKLGQSSSISKTTESAIHSKEHKGNLESDNLKKLLERFDIFSCRIRVSIYASAVSEDPKHTDKSLMDIQRFLSDIKMSASDSELQHKISLFRACIEEQETVASSFLLHFTQYVRSELDLHHNLSEMNNFLHCLMPCMEAAVITHHPKDVIIDIRNQNLIQSLFLSACELLREETKYRQESINTIKEMSQEANEAKAYITRMSIDDSKTVFQETFGDIGNHTDLYTIYIWQIVNICKIEVKEGKKSVLSETKAMKASGKFISTLPTSELKFEDSTLPPPHIPDVNITTQTTSTDTNGVTSSFSGPNNTAVNSDLRYQWVSFRVCQVYENGVIFLVNMDNWWEKLTEISTSVQKLEIKKRVKFTPSLGTTFALYMQEGIEILGSRASLEYIRVRVVRIIGPIVHLYGIDTGTIHTCNATNLILVPATILNHPPAGRLALLPVTPAPKPQILNTTLNLIVALVEHPELKPDLHVIDIKPIAKLMQCDAMTTRALQLLKALAEITKNVERLCNICAILTDYLERKFYRSTSGNFLLDDNLVKILEVAMQFDPKVRLAVAKNKTFISLCEVAIGSKNEQVWDTLLQLLGGKEGLRQWHQLSQKMTHIHSRRYEKPKSYREALSHRENKADSSMTILRVATMADDRNWDLEVRSTIKTRQHVMYEEHKGWEWDKQEISAPEAGELVSGHVLNVCNDETHHIILDKSVPNIRMNTILQIILGMLNTGVGGKIYIGLNNQGVVQGAKLTRDQRDCFMLGFSKLVTSEIFPMLLPCDALIQFIPVVRSGASVNADTPLSSILPLPLLSETSGYVIIMTVRPVPNTIYRYRDDPETYILREGGVNTFVRGNHLVRMINNCAVWTKKLEGEVKEEKHLMLETILSEKIN